MEYLKMVALFLFGTIVICLLKSAVVMVLWNLVAEYFGIATIEWDIALYLCLLVTILFGMNHINVNK